jgi:hypothetical protein
MHRSASILMATAVLFGGASIALAQTTTTVVTPVAPSMVPRPTFYTDYYKVDYHKEAPSRAEVVRILTQAGYQNPSDLSLENDVWTGKAMVDGHQVPIRFDRQGIWQLAP